MNRHHGNSLDQEAAVGRANRAIGGAALGASILGEGSTFVRFVVEEVFFDPMALDDDRLESIRELYGLLDAAFLRQMPPNTVVGRILNQGNIGHDRKHYLFPFFPPHLMLPVHAGEHVWAFFEDDRVIDHGFWICRISEPRHVDDLNHTHADRKFHANTKNSSRSSKEKFEGDTDDRPPSFANGPTFAGGNEMAIVPASASIPDGDSKVYEKLLKETDSGRLSELEVVPRFRKRPGDHVIQGSNNTLIALGTDRTSRTAVFETEGKGRRAKKVPSKDQTKEAGAIDVVVGRGRSKATAGKKTTNSLDKEEISKKTTEEDEKEGDPDFATDSGRLYLSMKSDVDRAFEINFSSDVEPGAAGVLKVDHVRVVARKTLKMLIQPRADAPESECAGILFKDGNVVFLPAADGLCLIGGEDASMVPLCQPAAVAASGQVSGPPIVSTLGSVVGGGGPNGQFPKKVLMR